MASVEGEQLQLTSPEYVAGLLDLTAVATSSMDDNPNHVGYERNASYLSLKTPNCGENEYYQLGRGLPFPYPENPNWSAIKPGVSKVIIRDGGLSSTTTTYSEREGILVSNVFIDDNNEDSGEPPITRALNLEEVQALTAEIRNGIPFNNDEEEPKAVQRKGRIGRFIASIFQAVPHTRSH